MHDRAGHVCPVLTPQHIVRGVRNGRYQFTELGLERLCSRCGEYYPADTEFFYFQPSTSGGLCSYCHACYREQRGTIHAESKKILAAAGVMS